MIELGASVNENDDVLADDDVVAIVIESPLEQAAELIAMSNRTTTLAPAGVTLINDITNTRCSRYRR